MPPALKKPPWKVYNHKAVSWVLAEGSVCSESPEKRVSVRSGIREDFPERVTLPLNLKDIVRISQAGDRRGREEASCQAGEIV